jgi:hypothetical protein
MDKETRQNQPQPTDDGDSSNQTPEATIVGPRIRAKKVKTGDINTTVIHGDLIVKVIRQVSEETGILRKILSDFLEGMGETALAKADPAKIEQLLRAWAERYLSLEEELRVLKGDDPEVQRLRETARQALRENRLQDFEESVRQVHEHVHAAIMTQYRIARVAAIGATALIIAVLGAFFALSWRGSTEQERPEDGSLQEQTGKVLNNSSDGSINIHSNDNGVIIVGNGNTPAAATTTTTPAPATPPPAAVTIHGDNHGGIRINNTINSNNSTEIPD